MGGALHVWEVNYPPPPPKIFGLNPVLLEVVSERSPFSNRTEKVLGPWKKKKNGVFTANTPLKGIVIPGSATLVTVEINHLPPQSTFRSGLVQLGWVCALYNSKLLSVREKHCNWLPTTRSSVVALNKT